MMPDYSDPWRTYRQPGEGEALDDAPPEPPPRKRLSGMQVFWRGVPFVIAFWILAANVPPM